MPESLEWVGGYAFYGCDGISTVNYNAINCQTMGSAANPVFYDCAFTHLNIGANVQSIPNFAFKRCFMITDMTVAAVNPPTIYPGTFGMVSRSIPVSVPHGSGDAYSGAPYWEEFFNIIEVYFNEVQTVQLSEGWSWWSTYIDSDDLLNQLKAALGTNGMSINTQGAALVYRNGMWMGGMHSIDNNKGYKIRTSAPVEVTIVGQIVDPSTCPITITQGANWIGYPLSESQTVGNALTGFTPSNGDVIMTQGGTTVYRSGHWMPATFTFEPGKSYIYKSTSSDTKTLIFSNGK